MLTYFQIKHYRLLWQECVLYFIYYIHKVWGFKNKFCLFYTHSCFSQSAKVIEKEYNNEVVKWKYFIPLVPSTVKKVMSFYFCFLKKSFNTLLHISASMNKHLFAFVLQPYRNYLWGKFVEQQCLPEVQERE